MTEHEMVKLSMVANNEISQRTDEYVSAISSLNDDPYFREAIMRFAVREFAWAMLESFDDERALAEQLELMADLVKQREAQDDLEQAS